jgi:hypothetical protein
MSEYEPELGQALWGCPTSEFDCPEFIEAGLRHLSNEIERVEWNRTQEEFDSPMDNTGASYKALGFELHAYYWGDCECGAGEDYNHAPSCRTMWPNFRCGDFEVRWYKYLGRGMSMNQDVDANTFFKIIDRCLASVRLTEPPIH